MSGPIEIIWPRGGLNENFATDKQPGASSSDLANVGNINPENGRDQGATRTGKTRQHPDKLHASAKVADLGSVKLVQKTVNYSQDEVSLWKTGTFHSWWVECDGDGNAYALTGPAAITKYSADGEKVYTFTVPVPAGGIVGTLDVDEGANVYCGVSGERGAPSGILGAPEPGNGMWLGDMDDARLWKLQHAFRNNDDETEPELEVAWELTMEPTDPGPTLHGLVTFVRVRGAKLYTLQQDNRQWRTWFVVYDSIHAGVPVEVYARDDIPYPGSMLDVDAEGNVVITSETFSRRGENPAHPESIAALTGWTLKDIDQDIGSGDKKHAVWFDLDPSRIDTLETTGGLIPEDGDEVLFARDANGSGRVLVFATPDGKRGPLWKKEGLGGKPELYFNGDLTAGIGQLLYTGVSPSGDADFRDGGRGLFPTYRDPDDAERSSQYAVVALLRPEAKTDGTTLTNQFPVWSHSVDNTTLSDQSALMINRGVVAAAADNLDTLAQADNLVNGAVSWYCRADASDPGQGSVSGLMPASYAPSATNPFGPFNNGANALLVSLIACNGVDAGADDTHTRSLMRVWGKPIDRFMQDPDANYATAKQWLGGSAHADFSTLGMFRGSICRIVVLDRKDLDAVGADSICTHPPGPDSSAGNIVGSVNIVAEGTGGANTTAALVFSGGSPTVPATGTWTSLNGRITTITLTGTGSGYTSVPTVTAPTFSGTTPTLEAGMAWAAGTHPSPTTVMEKLEGMLAWERGVSYLLHSGGFYVVQRINGGGGVGTYSWDSPHPYFYPVGITPFISDQGPPESATTAKIHKFAHKGEVLTYLDASGKLLDVLSHDLNGIGLGCRFNHDGTLIFTAGNTGAPDGTGSSAPASVATLRKIVVKDDKTLGWQVVDGGGQLLSPLRMLGQRCGLKVDAQDNVYLPCNAPTDTGDAFSLAVFSPLGVLIHVLAAPVAADRQGTYCVALPRAIEKADLEPVNPEYEGDLTHEIVEHVWLAGRAETYAEVPIAEAVQKYRLVLATPNNDQPSRRIDVGVAGGNIVRFDGVGIVTPSGGAAAIGTGYVHSVEAFQKHYFTDGAVDLVYDPKLDTVAPWTVKRGELPKRCRGLEFWRERVIRFACQDDPYAVFGSRTYKPDDWDRSPPVPTLDQSFVFAVPDRLTGFVPYNNDLAVVGGDHTLWRIDGDPMAGGRLSNISKSVGLAFGRAWCIDGAGRIWFMDDTGQLRTMAGPNGAPEPVSRDRIGRRLQSLDFSRYYLRLAYDRNREAVWILPLPYGDLEDEQIEGYYYDMRAGAFFPHFIDDLQGQVTALHVIDGDEPNDRRVLFGHGNGFVTYANDETTLDDVTPIRSRVLLGPYKADGVGREIRTIRLGMLLSSNQGGLTWNLYASATPDDKGAIKRSGTFGPGNNHLPSAKTLGAYFWIELLQNQGHGRFAFEKAWLTYEIAGERQKVRP